jgi:phosphoribosylamine--glycine ligase
VKLLLIDSAGDGLLDLAVRAKALGHQVRCYLQSHHPQKRPVGRGMVERVDDWRGSMKWADLVLLGGNGKWMAEIDRWREMGVPIVGGSVESASWELDRIKGMAVLKHAGIPVPAFREVRHFDDAIAIAAKYEAGCAIKPSGDVADKSLSFVAKTPREAVWRLQRWKREGRKFGQGLILQDRIQGIEYAVGAWFGPNGFADGWEENFEEKRLFAGSLGPNCGEAGTVMRLVRSSKLADKVLKPVEEQLGRIGYVGNVDINCIVDSEGNPWPLEFTMRFGYPAINIELALHRADPIEFLACVASGDKPPMRQMNDVAVGVVLMIPPFVFGHERAEEVVNVPIWGVTPGIEDDLHFCDVMHGDAPMSGGAVKHEPHLATAGSYVCVATGTAGSVVEARQKAHRVLDRLTIPASPAWRNDIGSRLRKQLPELQRNGYARGMVYSS